MKSEKGTFIIDNNDLNNLANYYLEDYLNNNLEKKTFEIPHKIVTNKIITDNNQKKLQDFLLIFYFEDGSVEFEVERNQDNGFLLSNLKIRLNSNAYDKSKCEDFLIIQENKDKESYNLNLTMLTYKDQEIYANKLFEVSKDFKVKTIQSSINPEIETNGLEEDFDNLFLQQELTIDIYKKIKNNIIYYIFKYYKDQNSINNILIMESGKFNELKAMENNFYDLSRISKENLKVIHTQVSSRNDPKDSTMWNMRALVFINLLLNNKEKYVRANPLEIFIEGKIKSLIEENKILNYLENLPSNHVKKIEKDLQFKVGFSENGRDVYLQMGCFGEFNDTVNKENAVITTFRDRIISK